MTVVPPGESRALGPREGFLVLQVDTDIPIDDLSLRSGSVSTGLPRGRHLWVVRARAGRDGWQSIRPARAAGRSDRLSISDLRRAMKRTRNWVWDDEFDFEIKAGVINYPGELIIRSRGPELSPEIRNRNHSAMALREMLETHPQLLDAYPLRHSGPGDDGFLEHYSRERARLLGISGGGGR